MLNPNGIAHAGLKAENLTNLCGFYETQVGLPLLERSDGCHIFDIGSGTLFEIWSGGFSADERKSPAQQSVRICFRVERLEASIQGLKSRGVLPIGEIGTYLGTRWIHYIDPEGNTFGLVDMHG